MLQCPAVIDQARAFGKFFAQVLKRYCRYLLCLPTALVLPTKRKKETSADLDFMGSFQRNAAYLLTMWLPDS
jgi:hypothetical protein